MRVSPVLPVQTDQRLTLDLQLQVGQHITGRVLQELGQGRWVVRTQGQDLIVASSVQLEQGDMLHAEVIRTGDPVQIRLLAEPTVPNMTAPEILNQMGISVNPENTALLETILQLGWPPALLESLLPYIQALPGQLPVNAVLAWLMGFPPHPHLLASLRTLTEPQAPLGHLLDQLQNELRALLQGQQHSPLHEKMSLLQRALPPPSEDGLLGWLNQLNTSYEAQLLRTGGMHDHIKSILLDIQRFLEHIAPQVDSPASRTIEQILHQLDAHAMVNQKPLDYLPAFYFQIPYQLGGHTATLEFKGEPVADEEDAFELTFVAHTRNLGKLKIILKLAGREVSCALFTEDEPTRRIVNAEQDALKQRLQALEYHVARLWCSVASPDAFVLKVVQAMPALLNELPRLDIRV